MHSPSTKTFSVTSAPMARAFMAAAMITLVFTGVADAETAATLQISKTSARAASPAIVSIRLEPVETQISALTFTLAYDTSKLVLDTSTNKFGQLTQLELDLPDGFSHTEVADPAKGTVGISIFDAKLPLSSLPAGEILRIRFTTRPAAEGHAAVRMVGKTSASDRTGRRLPAIASTEGGVTISAGRAAFTVSPASVDFGSVPAGSSEKRSLAITNNGFAPLSIVNLKLNGSLAFAFASFPDFPRVLAPGATVAVEFIFGGPHQGLQTGFASIEFAQPLPSPILVPLAGTLDRAGEYSYNSISHLPAVISRQNGTRVSRTAVGLHNASRSEASARLFLVDRDGRERGSASVSIGADRTIHSPDVLSDLFATTGNYTGSIRIEASTSALIIASELLSTTASSGTTTSPLPVIRAEALFHSGQTIVVPRLSAGGAASKIHLQNLSSTTATFQVRILGTEGNALVDSEFTVSANSSTEITPTSLNGAIFTLRIEAKQEGVTFFAYTTEDDQTGATIVHLPR